MADIPRVNPSSLENLSQFKVTHDAGERGVVDAADTIVDANGRIVPIDDPGLQKAARAVAQIDGLEPPAKQFSDKVIDAGKSAAATVAESLKWWGNKENVRRGLAELFNVSSADGIEADKAVQSAVRTTEALIKVNTLTGEEKESIVAAAEQSRETGRPLKDLLPKRTVQKMLVLNQLQNELDNLRQQTGLTLKNPAVLGAVLDLLKVTAVACGAVYVAGAAAGSASAASAEYEMVMRAIRNIR